MHQKFRNFRGSFFTLLEIVIVLAIIMFLAQKMIRGYFQKPAMDKQVETIAHEVGIDTANYQSVVQSTRDKVRDITQQRQNELGAIDK